MTDPSSPYHPSLAALDPRTGGVVAIWTIRACPVCEPGLVADGAESERCREHGGDPRIFPTSSGQRSMRAPHEPFHSQALARARGRGEEYNAWLRSGDAPARPTGREPPQGMKETTMNLILYPTDSAARRLAEATARSAEHYGQAQEARVVCNQEIAAFAEGWEEGYALHVEARSFPNDWTDNQRQAYADGRAEGRETRRQDDERRAGPPQ